MFKKTNIILTTVIGILLLSACSGETGESATENNDNNSKKENQQQEEAFDVHGIELKVKEEPEKIEKEEEVDVEGLDMDDAFNLSEERMKEIVTAIVEQDEETFRKHNYFGDRILDDKLEQTVHMDVEGDEFESDDPMEEESENEKEENKEKIKQLSEKTFDNPSDYIAFQNDFEAELDKDFQENIDEIEPEGESEKHPLFYRTDDVLEYADHEGLTDIDLDDYKIKTTVNHSEVKVNDGDYTSNSKSIKLENKEAEAEDDYYIELRFNKYKDGFYYLNGVEI